MTNLYSETDMIVRSGIATLTEHTLQPIERLLPDVIQDRLANT